MTMPEDYLIGEPDLGVTAYDSGKVNCAPETDSEREARLRASPLQNFYDVNFLLAQLDKARVSISDLEGKLQYVSAVGAAAMSAIHKAGLSVPSSIDVDGWLAARAEQQFQQRATSNDWIERLHGNYQSPL